MLSGRGLADYALSKLGTPYFYGSKMNVLTEAFMRQMNGAYPSTVTSAYIRKARAKGMVGKVCCDCSGLIGAYRGKQIGSSQLYSSATKRIPVADWRTFPVGTVLWKNGHVGVYIGDGMVVEEKGIDYGCIKSRIESTAWKYGLLFSDMNYDVKVVKSESKGANPYTEPTMLITSNKIGIANKLKSFAVSGESVKWVQWELIEAGFKEEIYKAGGIDGICGDVTANCIKEFQRSCKITADGIVGKDTRAYLKAK